MIVSSKSHKIKIVYMGTPEFAVEPLKKLVENSYDIRAVITATDKPAGRGKQIRFSDVKSFALENNIKILQPQNLKCPDFINELKSINADLFIVVAFRMLPKEIWQIPKLGTFNLHASLLPDYRGAAPINHVLINGETQTGVTTFFINEDIDTGNVILQQTCQIDEKDNAGSLHDKLKNIGSDLVLQTVKLIEKDDVVTTDQNKLVNGKLKDAPKLNKEFCKICFDKPVSDINNFIRGLSPYPAAWFSLDGTNETVKLFSGSIILEKHDYLPGKIITDNKSFIHIACLDGFLNIIELQISGKKRMFVKDFLNGYNTKCNYTNITPKRPI